MKFILAILCSLLAMCSYPKKIKTKLPLLKNNSSEVIRKELQITLDTIKSKNYTEIIFFEDSIPRKWEIVGPNRAVSFEGSDPCKMTVYFNPAATKFFHVFHDCKKLGAFRKLTETPIDDFLKKNKSAAICPDCMDRNKSLYFIVQFLLDDE